MKRNTNPALLQIEKILSSEHLIKLEKCDSIHKSHLNIGKEARIQLRKMYRNKKKAVVIYASILKASILQKRIAFLFSKSLITELIKNDPDSQYRSINSKEYKALIRDLFGTSTLYYLRKSEEGFAGQGKAAIVCWHTNIIKYIESVIGEEVDVKHQKEEAILIWENFKPSHVESDQEEDEKKEDT
jgi:hypothetical protein